MKMKGMVNHEKDRSLKYIIWIGWWDEHTQIYFWKAKCKAVHLKTKSVGNTFVKDSLRDALILKSS